MTKFKVGDKIIVEMEGIDVKSMPTSGKDSEKTYYRIKGDWDDFSFDADQLKQWGAKLCSK
jgi:hypothetical protein